MKISIYSIDNSNELVVNCLSEFGQFNVNWKGEIPLVNQEYNIELEIEKNLIWGNDIELSSSDHCIVREENQRICITAELSSVDDDGYTTLKMGNYLLSFMAKGNAFEIGSFIQIIIDSIDAYPYNY